MSEPSDSAAFQAIRAAQHHHVTLAAVADIKASLMLAAALVTLAITLPQALHEQLQYPVIALAATALLTTINSILALTPRLLMLKNSDEQPDMNLLFCGHFANLDEAQYVERLRTLLSTEQSAQDAMARDLYQMGYILNQKKLRHLATAYTVSVIGLVITAVTWVVSLLGLI